MSKTFTSGSSVAPRARGSTRRTNQQTNTRGAGRGRALTNSGVFGRGVTLSNSSVSTSRTVGQSSIAQSPGDRMHSNNPYGARSRGDGVRMNPSTRVNPQSRLSRPPREGDEVEELGAVGGRGREETQAQEQTMTHQGGYTMVSPNERKRQQINEQAQRETEEYEKFKAANKPSHVSYRGTVGGGQITEAEARRRLVVNNSNTKFKLQEKRRVQKEETRRQEELKYEEKKGDARRKTEENQRRELRENDKKKREMDRIKNKFLDRLEKTTPKASTSCQSINPNASISTAPSRSHDREPTNQTRQKEERQPMKTDSDDLDHMIPEMNSDLQTLVSMFPQYDPSVIAEIYGENQSLEVTAEILADS